MMERRYRYDSQDQLKLLVGLLAENNIELSVGMRAVVPEEFSRLREKVLRAKTMTSHPEHSYDKCIELTKMLLKEHLDFDVDKQ